MNVAKWLLLTLLALPFMELVAFIAVAQAIGFLRALVLMIATSVAGAMVLRYAGGNHIARIRVAMGAGIFTTLQADGPRTLKLLAGVVDLAREQWHQVPDPALPDRRNSERDRSV